MKNYKSVQPNTNTANKNIKKYLIPEGFSEFNEFFGNL